MSIEATASILLYPLDGTVQGQQFVVVEEQGEFHIMIVTVVVIVVLVDAILCLASIASIPSRRRHDLGESVRIGCAGHKSGMVVGNDIARAQRFLGNGAEFGRHPALGVVVGVRVGDFQFVVVVVVVIGAAVVYC